MAQGFARFYRRFWADERVRQLSPEEKLVAAYLLTGQSNRIGLFRFSVGMAEDDTGIPRKRLDTLLDRVCDTLQWGYDRDARVIWIRSWWRWNDPESPKTMTGYLKDLADIPKTALLADFRNNRDTLSDTLWNTLCHRVPDPPSPSPSLSPSLSLSRAFPEPKPEPVRVVHAARAPFAKPTLAEVSAYCADRQQLGKKPVDPERFLSHYESNGWRVGRNPMKDWKSAVVTWEGSELNGNGTGKREKMTGRQIMDFAKRMKAEETSRG